MADKGILTRDQQEVFDTLAGIGPDTLGSDFFGTYLFVMQGLVKTQEAPNNREAANNNKDSALRAAFNYPVMSLLVALLKLHPRPFEPIAVGEKRTIISPLALAKIIRAE